MTDAPTEPQPGSEDSSQTGSTGGPEPEATAAAETSPEGHAEAGPTGRSDRARATTWAALLAKWTEFAQAAVALPDTDAGGRWREAVAPIIELQAVTHALAELDELPDADRPASLDKAELTCRAAAARLHAIWRAEPMPSELDALINDARIAFELAANAGVEWLVAAERLVVGHPADLAERLAGRGFAGELFLPTPGVPLFRGAVAAFARGPGGGVPPPEVAEAVARFLATGATGSPDTPAVSEPERIGLPRQVYRQFDFAAGGPVKDLVVPMNEPLPPGQPLLVLAMEAGEPQPVPLPPPRPIDLQPLPVEVVEPESADESPTDR